MDRGSREVGVNAPERGQSACDLDGTVVGRIQGDGVRSRPAIEDDGRVGIQIPVGP